MGADSYRKQVEPVLYRLSTVFLRYNPNTLTVISFILALLTAAVLILAGRIFPFYLIIIAFVTLFLSAFLDAMDGFVARRKNISSSYGDMLDHTFDRYSDLALITGFALSLQGDILLGLLALGGVFMASYMGTQAQAVGLKRNYGGVLGRADRLILMIIAIIIEAVYPFSYVFFIPITTITILLVWFAIGGHITAAIRFRKTVADMKAK
ncbi:MAG: CDP-alcohol phosphatidyltransferase family protein [Candidatus Thermoplasmatota archaeon]|nr:CDP-alcohol phosphatidyltransferase family protein [Candidatus Thermoplasmatota archaeon]